MWINSWEKGISDRMSKIMPYSLGTIRQQQEAQYSWCIMDNEKSGHDLQAVVRHGILLDHDEVVLILKAVWYNPTVSNLSLKILKASLWLMNGE